jgi:predicted ATPase
MIHKIEIKNFKSIQAAEIAVGNLNLFTGVNGSGKSTFLQCLLLIRQSYLSGSLFREPYALKLTDSEGLVNLGTFKDVICHQAKKGEEIVEFNILFDNQKLQFISELYGVENRDLNTLKIKLNESIFCFDKKNLFNNYCQYLAAERIEPNEDYPRFNQTNELLGKRGEYTAHYLEKYGSSDIPIRELSFTENSNSFTIINQVNDWMGEISKSIEVIATENLNTNRIELAYRYKLSDGTPTQNQKPQNVGFGITHTLPIIVAVLSAQKGSAIFIENPESHLHPSGQARLAFLFAKAAQNGVQLFIETHSDHIINGLRVAVKKKMIDTENVFLNYFSKDGYGLSLIKRINVQSDGGLTEWPDGFFDEWDNLLNELL